VEEVKNNEKFLKEKELILRAELEDITKKLTELKHKRKNLKEQVKCLQGILFFVFLFCFLFPVIFFLLRMELFVVTFFCSFFLPPPFPVLSSCCSCWRLTWLFIFPPLLSSSCWLLLLVVVGCCYC